MISWSQRLNFVIFQSITKNLNSHDTRYECILLLVIWSQMAPIVSLWFESLYFLVEHLDVQFHSTLFYLHTIIVGSYNCLIFFTSLYVVCSATWGTISLNLPFYSHTTNVSSYNCYIIIYFIILYEQCDLKYR